MNEAIIEFAGNHRVVVAVGGIGAALGLITLALRCMKIKAWWARCLFFSSDALNTVFVSITVVGVLAVSLSLVFHLPGRQPSLLDRVTELTNLVESRGNLRSTVGYLHATGELGDSMLIVNSYDNAIELMRRWFSGYADNIDELVPGSTREEIERWFMNESGTTRWILIDDIQNADDQERSDLSVLIGIEEKIPQ